MISKADQALLSKKGISEPCSQPHLYHPVGNCFDGTPDHQGENDQR